MAIKKRIEYDNSQEYQNRRSGRADNSLTQSKLSGSTDKESAVPRCSEIRQRKIMKLRSQ